MIIALDCDEVLLNTGLSLYDFYVTEFDGEGISPHSYSSTWPAFENDIEKWRQWFSRWGDSRFYTTIPPLPGAQEAITKLKEMGHTLYVVSKSPAHLLNTRRDHLNQLFSNAFADVKLVGFDLSKATVLEEIQADIFVDDDKKNIIECHDIVQCIAFKNETNRDKYDATTFPKNVKVADGWNEVLEIITTENK